MLCPACQAENDESAENCFTCGGSLSTVITRGTVLVSRYESVRPLGKGGMGMVYLAQDHVLEEPAAIKVLRADAARSAEMVRRFRSEIKLARKVRHKNVCGIHEYRDEGGIRFISMEYVEGVDLRQVLRMQGPFPPLEALDIAIQVADGLQAVHDVGIVHRDLKTPNIMRDAKGLVRLMDFGIAKEVDSGTRATATGMIVGTPEYMSPEQARGEKVDTRSDIYALGVVIFELFTGDVPFKGETPLATLMKHLQEPPPLDGPCAAGVPPPLRDVLRRTLAKHPEERHQTAEAVASELRKVRAELFPEATRTPRPLPVVAPGPIRTPPPVAVRGPLPALSGTLEDVTTAVPTAIVTSVRTTVDTPPPSTIPQSPAEAPVLAPARVRAIPVRRPPESGASVAASTQPRSSWPGSLPHPRAGPSPRPWLLAAGAVALFGGVALVMVLLRAPAQPSAPASGSAATLAAVPAVARPDSTAEAARAGAALPAPVPMPAAAEPTPPLLPSLQGERQAPVARKATPASAPAPSTPPPIAASATTLPMLRLRPETPVASTEPEAPPAPVARPEPGPVASPVALQPAAAEPAARAEVRDGLLQVLVLPWAEVMVDGIPKGTTPLPKLSLPAGTHTLRLKHPQFEPLERKVTIQPGQTETLRVNLTTEATMLRPAKR